MGTVFEALISIILVPRLRVSTVKINAVGTEYRPVTYYYFGLLSQMVVASRKYDTF